MFARLLAGWLSRRHARAQYAEAVAAECRDDGLVLDLRAEWRELVEEAVRLPREDDESEAA